MTFAGFRSRWITPRSCAAARPAQICRAISSARSDEKRPNAPKQRSQLLAVDELHRQERLTLDFVDVVHATDVRVRHLPRHPHFVVELHQPRGILIDFRRQKLQGDLLTEFQVVCPVHLAHSALAQPADDAVAAAEHGARRKTPVIDLSG